LCAAELRWCLLPKGENEMSEWEQETPAAPEEGGTEGGGDDAGGGTEGGGQEGGCDSGGGGDDMGGESA
jgi:uncharacterized membrane protein YgcG